MIDSPSRIPPHNLDAERAVLGAMLLEGREALPRVIEILRPSDFYTEAHRVIYATMVRLFDRSEGVDLITLSEELRRADQLERVGGPSALALLVEQASIAAHLSTYAMIVRQKAARRETIQRATEIVAAAFDDPAEDDGRISAALADLAALVERGADAAKPAAQSVGAVVRHMLTSLDEQETDFVPSPFQELNDRLGGGLLRGELVYLKGPAAAAKTAAAIQWAALAANLGAATLVVSREMTAMALGRRFIAQQLRVPAGALRRRQVSEHHRTAIEAALVRFDGLPLTFDDQTETISGILHAAKRGGYRFVVVDYVQLVTSPADSKDERRELEAVSRGLKRLAMHGCSVLALSAVTRLLTDGRNKKERPNYQLRGSERLQHDADVVLTLYRPSDETQDRVLVYDKLREGESGGFTTLEFSSTYLTFDQVEEHVPRWVQGKDD